MYIHMYVYMYVYSILIREMADPSGGPAQGAGASLPAHWDGAAGSQPAAGAPGLQAIDGGSCKQLLFPELADLHVVNRQQGFFPARLTGGGSHGKGGR